MRKFLNKMLKDQRGFTLIELIIVVVILAMLAGVALLNSGGAEKDAQTAKIKSDVAALATALKTFKLKTGAYPVSPSPGLDALTKPDASGKYAEPMIDEVPLDPSSTGGTAKYGYTYDATAKTATVTAADGTSKVLK